MDPKYLFNENVEKMNPVGLDLNMGYIFATTAVAGIIVAVLVYWLLSNTARSVPSDFVSSRHPTEHQVGPFRVQASRPAHGDDDDDDLNVDSNEVDDKKPKKKIGVKKAAKLEMKAEKRAAREIMLQEREERKREQEFLDDLKRQEDEKLKKEEEEREEQERKDKEDQARKEHEAYLELAANFEVEEEGFDPDEDVDSQAKLLQFIDYINEQKVLTLEQLASHFNMRTKDTVDRVQQLIANGTLTGIIDDRGKYIGITESELQGIAKFIRQRGRVTVDELVVNSNKLINLKPDVKVT